MPVPAARILIVDDDPSARDIVSRRLEMEGHELIPAENGWEALEKLKEIAPDMMILDMMMPGLDGIGVLKRLRADANYVSLPVLMLTARDRAVDKQFGLESGADDYLGKPFEFPELVGRVNALLRRSRGWSVSEETVRRGHIITVMSAKGGAGATTIAVNLAVALAKQPVQTILADFTWWGGTATSHLGLPARRRLDRIPLNKPEILTPAMIENTMLDHASGLRVLASRLREVDLIPDEGADALVEAVRRCADYVVMDTDGDPHALTRAACRVSSQVWIVVEPEQTCIERATALIEQLDAQGVTSRRVGVILNQTSPTMSVTAAEAEAALGIPPTVFMASMPNACAAALARGGPIVDLAPQLPASIMFRALAAAIADRPLSIQRAPEGGPVVATAATAVAAG